MAKEERNKPTPDEARSTSQEPQSTSGRHNPAAASTGRLDMAKDEQHPLSGSDNVIPVGKVHDAKVSRQDEPPIRSHTITVPFLSDPATGRCHLAVCGAVPTSEMLGTLHLLNIYIRDLTEECALAAEMAEPVSTPALAALRYLTSITTAISEAISD